MCTADLFIIYYYPANLIFNYQEYDKVNYRQFFLLMTIN